LRSFAAVTTNPHSLSPAGLIKAMLWNTTYINYIMCQVILVFWLVLSYDLSEERCIGVVINIFFFGLFLYYTKQVNSMLQCICSVIDHRRHRKMWNEQQHFTHSPDGSFPTFLFLPHFDISSNLLLNRHMATWNLFVNLTMSRCFWMLPVHMHCDFQEPLCTVFLRPRIKIKFLRIQHVIRW